MLTRTGYSDGGSIDQRRRTISSTRIGTLYILLEANSDRRDKSVCAKRLALKLIKRVGKIRVAMLDSNIGGDKVEFEF